MAGLDTGVYTQGIPVPPLKTFPGKVTKGIPGKPRVISPLNPQSPHHHGSVPFGVLRTLDAGYGKDPPVFLDGSLSFSGQVLVMVVLLPSPSMGVYGW